MSFTTNSLYLARLKSLTTFDMVMGLAGTLLLLGFLTLLYDSLRRRNFAGKYAAGLLGALAGSGYCFVMLYTELHHRYLLQEGPYRYTIAQVTDHSRQRGKLRFWYHYQVAARDLLGAKSCGISQWRDLPCPPVGTRFYVKYSVTEPAVQELTEREVSDSVRTIPPLGWAKLP